MNNLAQPARLPRLRRKPGPAETEALLDHIPEAVLLVDVRDRVIQMGNSKAAELSAYTRAELPGLRLVALFEIADDARLLSETLRAGGEMDLGLVRRNKSRLDVQVKRLDMGTGSDWAVLQIIPGYQVEQIRAAQKQKSAALESASLLGRAVQQPDLSSALELVLQGARGVTGMTLMSIYLQESNETHLVPELVRYVHDGPSEPLPACLDAQELAHLRNPHIWNKGKRPASALHRSARANGLGYIATYPLGQPGAIIGLLVAGAENQPLDELTSERLKQFAIFATGLIEIHSRYTSLVHRLSIEKRQTGLLGIVADSIEDGLLLLDGDMTISLINAAAEQLLGYTRSEAMGRPVEDILIGTGSLNYALKLARQDITTLREESIHIYRRSGQMFHTALSAIPLFDGTDFNGMVVLFHDLSIQEQIQAQAKQLEQRALLGEVTAVFAHEVRNPINNISTGLQLLAYTLGEGHASQDLIGRLQHDCDRLGELMKSVLAFSRPTEYVMEAVDIAMLLHRLLERLRPRMQRARVEPLFQAESDLPRVRGNPRALEQVFNNLVTNSIQAMQDTGGTVAIKIQHVGAGGERHMVQVDVADSGPGISREQQEHIFQPFFTTKSDGTGLGLPITKRIITAHKGNIQLTSFPGGTVFHVTLPIMETE